MAPLDDAGTEAAEAFRQVAPAGAWGPAGPSPLGRAPAPPTVHARGRPGALAERLARPVREVGLVARRASGADERGEHAGLRVAARPGHHVLEHGQPGEQAEILDPVFHHLIDSTWALIAHEKLASLEDRYALFSPANPLAELSLAERIRRYAEVGERIDRRDPESALTVVGF